MKALKVKEYTKKDLLKSLRKGRHKVRTLNNVLEFKTFTFSAYECNNATFIRLIKGEVVELTYMGNDLIIVYNSIHILISGDDTLIRIERR